VFDEGKFSNSPWEIKPVGSYPDGESPYGILDMMGNAPEWVNDFYGADYYSVSPYANPQGPETNSSTFVENRVIRGYWWEDPTAMQRTSFENIQIFSSINPYGIGFRCAH
jgi:formylglycine-generating enzyme required for sulfatase activity